MQLNWIDWVIVAIVAFYILDGWEQGLLRLGSSLISFLAALWLAVKWHAPAGAFLVAKFGVPSAWSNVLGYAAVAILAEIVISEIVSWAVAKLPTQLWKSKINHGLGAALSVAKGLVMVALGLLLLLVLPLRGTVRADIRQSQIGGFLVSQVEKYGGNIKSSFDQAAKQAIRFLTIRPTSTERVELDVAPTASQLTVNPTAEAKMVELVNSERAKAGLKSLIVDTKTVAVARDHSRDMFSRRYFSHINPEGQDAADRLEKGGVKFSLAGENLAYAPDVVTAHQGLMDSEGHRANILHPDFSRIGIGVIDAGIYGMMFTQNFTD